MLFMLKWIPIIGLIKEKNPTHNFKLYHKTTGAIVIITIIFAIIHLCQ